MRTLRPWGVRVYTLSDKGLSIPNASRFCAGTFEIGSGGRPIGQSEKILEQLLTVGRRLGEGAILVAGSDEWSVFVGRHSDQLRPAFRFPDAPIELVEGLASKQGLFELACRHGLPTPRILVPAGEEELVSAAGELDFPVMLKPIQSRPGRQGLELAIDRDQLISRYRAMADPGNVLCQEYIPGSDKDVWVFNGYFNAESRCLAAFTGRKIRQYPPHMGLIALGVCERNEQMAVMTERFLAAAGYRGVVDIGYRWDRRDGQYKVLDINPRLGGAFRLFVDRQGLDVVRAMYLDLTGSPVPAVEPNDGRKWILEAAEILSLPQYRRDGELTVLGWMCSLRGLEEGATFSIRDPLPFVVAMRILAEDSLAARLSRFSSLFPRQIKRPLQAPSSETGGS